MVDERGGKLMKVLASAGREGAQAALRAAAESYLEGEEVRSEVERELKEADAEVVAEDVYSLTITLRLASQVREEVVKVLETVEPRIKAMAPGLIESIKVETGCSEVTFLGCEVGLEPSTR